MLSSDWSSDVFSSDLVPVGSPGIARLMIAFARIGIDPRLPRFLAAIDQIGRARDAHHQQDGDAALGEAEMVGAVEEAAFGQALGRYGAALRPREAREIILQAALSLASEDDVLGDASGPEDDQAGVGTGLVACEVRFLGTGLRP